MEQGDHSRHIVVVRAEPPVPDNRAAVNDPVLKLGDPGTRGRRQDHVVDGVHGGQPSCRELRGRGLACRRQADEPREQGGIGPQYAREVARRACSQHPERAQPTVFGQHHGGVEPAPERPGGERAGHLAGEVADSGPVGERTVEDREPLVDVRSDRGRQDDGLCGGEVSQRHGLGQWADTVEPVPVRQALAVVVDAERPSGRAAPSLLQPYVDERVEDLKRGSQFGRCGGASSHGRNLTDSDGDHGSLSRPIG